MKIIHEYVNDDWERLYVDGEVVYENHSIPDHEWKSLLKKLGASVKTRSVEEEC